jgi:hypothetical protein
MRVAVGDQGVDENENYEYPADDLISHSFVILCASAFIDAPKAM